MINLLPPEEKNGILFEKRKKLTIILGISLIIPLICFGLILLSINFYILGEINLAKAILDQNKKEIETQQFLTLKDTIKKSNTVLSNLASFYGKETYISEILNTLSLMPRPENVYFTDISLTRDANQKIKVVASGFSGSRDNLLIFQKNIETNQDIESVYFSPESWVSPKNVTFYLTFSIK